MNDVQYAGFWVRVGAAFIDSVLMLIIMIPILTMIYGQGYWQSEEFLVGFWDVIINYLLPAIAVLLFWVHKSATPGKIFFDLKIVDAKTAGKPTNGQLIGRYLCYYISIFPFMLGILWVAVDKRKQGWHDKLAGTVVIRDLTHRTTNVNSQ